MNPRKHTKGILQLWLCVACFFMGYFFNSIEPRLLTSVDGSRKSAAAASQRGFLIVLAFSAPKNFERREAMRKTWLGDGSAGDIKVFFVVGNKSLPSAVETKLQSEISNHDDLLLLPVSDGYTALTEKVLEAFVRVKSAMAAFNYLLKVDDDTFVNLPGLLDELRHSNYVDGLYWGFFDGRAPVQKTGKWAEKDYLLCDRYIPYALGGGYVLSANLVQYIVRNKDHLKLFKNEDAAVGTWLAPLKSLHRVHDTRFDTEFKSRGCANTYLVSHKQSPEEMISKQEMLKSSRYRVLCAKEFQVRPSYDYKWDASPSKCCRREDKSLR